MMGGLFLELLVVYCYFGDYLLGLCLGLGH